VEIRFSLTIYTIGGLVMEIYDTGKGTAQERYTAILQGEYNAHRRYQEIEELVRADTSKREKQSFAFPTDDVRETECDIRIINLPQVRKQIEKAFR